MQGLRPEIRESVVLQQPDSLEAGENFAKLKESVSSSSEKAPAVDAKQISAQIVDELSKAVASKDKPIVAAAGGQQVFNVDKTDIKRMSERQNYHVKCKSKRGEIGEREK